MSRGAARNQAKVEPFNVDAGRHPFVDWYASLWRAKAAAWEEKDLILDDLGAKRFAMGVDPGGVPVLGVLEEDVRAVTSFRWSSAAFVVGHRGRDWMALSCRDARIEGAEEMNPVAIRLWIPVGNGLMQAWANLKPTRMRIRVIGEKGGIPSALDRPHLLEIPLALKGPWPA